MGQLPMLHLSWTRCPESHQSLASWHSTHPTLGSTTPSSPKLPTTASAESHKRLPARTHSCRHIYPPLVRPGVPYQLHPQQTRELKVAVDHQHPQKRKKEHWRRRLLLLHPHPSGAGAPLLWAWVQLWQPLELQSWSAAAQEAWNTLLLISSLLASSGTVYS